MKLIIKICLIISLCFTLIISVFGVSPNNSFNPLGGAYNWSTSKINQLYNLNVPYFTKVYAVEDGEVVHKGYYNKVDLGMCLTIKSTSNYTQYRHLSSVTDKVFVKKGDFIGTVGNTGFVTTFTLGFIVYDYSTYKLRNYKDRFYNYTLFSDASSVYVPPSVYGDMTITDINGNIVYSENNSLKK